jgi:hypothetical protein
MLTSHAVKLRGEGDGSGYPTRVNQVGSTVVRIGEHARNRAHSEGDGAACGEPASTQSLLPTYAPSPTFQRRFDSIWATPEFELVEFAKDSEAVAAAGGITRCWLPICD